MKKYLFILLLFLNVSSTYSGEGYDAGYEWAEENDVDDCGGNSQSFIEGCEEYLEEKQAQIEEDEQSEENDEF